MYQKIDSIKDRRIVLARALKTRSGRESRGQVLLEGERILDWAIDRDVAVDFVLLADPPAGEIVEKYAARDIEVFVVSGGIQKKVTGTNYVIPVVAVGRPSPPHAESSSDFVVVLDGVKDFGNIGTIIRTCQAFGVQEVIGTSGDFDVYYRKTIEASRGSVFSARVDRFENRSDTIAYLRERGYQIVVTSPRGTGLQGQLQLRQGPVALIVGNESEGAGPEFEQQADHVIRIPMSADIESLNVGVATGISVYEIRLKQVLTMIEQQIKSTLGRELNVAGMLVRRALDVELRKVSALSSRHVIFMMVLRCDQTMTVPQMCRQFGLLETEADRFLHPLIGAGLVNHGKELELTSTGEETLVKLWFTIEATEKRILSDFTAEESAALMRRLRRIQARCTEMVSGGPSSNPQTSARADPQDGSMQL